jgi:dTDP-4-dehydrorhamnose reductase
MKYLLTGKYGQLARAFIRRFERQTIDYLAPDESHLDITDSTTVSAAVEAYRPDVIINCAAYNLVDKAEQDRDAAFRVNAEGPKNLARAAAVQKALLVHFSSDYVFDGRKESGLYTEEDAVNPLNEYGKSKLTGEQHVLEENQRCLLLRLSWVFGYGKQNFIYKLSEWSKKNEYLKIACDEFSVPTYTDTVVDITFKAIETGIVGKYHLTNGGYCSRYEWAKVILNVLGINKFIRPVSMDEFQLPARRPKFSAMSNGMLERMLNVNIPSWQDAVALFLKEGGLVGE